MTQTHVMTNRTGQTITMPKKALDPSGDFVPAVFSSRRREVPHAIGAAAEGGVVLERLPLLTEFECRRQQQQQKERFSTTTTKRSSGCTREHARQGRLGKGERAKGRNLK